MIDGRKVVLAVTGSPVEQPVGCPEISDEVMPLGSAKPLMWGDVDCSGPPVSVIDGRKVVLAVTGSPAEQPVECPAIGEEVHLDVGPTESAPPTALTGVPVTPTPTPGPTPTPSAAPTPLPAACGPERIDVPIPDGLGPHVPGRPAEVPVIEEDVGQVTALVVCVQITHTYVGDLTIELVHGKTTVILVNRIQETGVTPTDSGCAYDNMYVLLQDGAPASAIDGCENKAPYAVSGDLEPVEPLAAFEGMDSAGEWTLRVADNYDNDTGTIISWELYINELP